MSAARFRLLLIVFVLVGATVTIGFSLDDDADLLMLQGPAYTLRFHSLERVSSPLRRYRLSRTDSEITSPLSVSVISLVSVLRC